jgi:uncharacterized protein (TIGR02302 family)
VIETPKPPASPRPLNAASHGFRIYGARLAIWWERVWFCLWPALCVVAAFLIVSLLGLLPDLNGWLHLVILIGFGLAFAYAIGWLVPGLRRPSRREAIRRLEQVNQLEHRPLTRIEDPLATGNVDREAAALWELYRRRTASQLGNLRIGAPHPNIVAKDPFALRAVLGLLLVVALVVGWKDAPERLHRAVSPSLSGFDFGSDVTVTLSVTPPAYTDVAPLFLEHRPASETGADTAAAPAAISIPAGSLVLAQLQGLSEAPTLKLGDASTPFEPLEPGTFQGKGEIRSGSRLAVAVEDQEIVGWPVTIVPDNAPSIDFAAKPGASERFALRLAYKAADDYGIRSVNATIRRADGKTGPGGIARIELRLPLPGVDPKKAQQVTFHDLTPHAWAGLPVEIQLTASDAVGQTGKSAWIKTILPERVFNHPVARAVVEQRKRLIESPDQALNVARKLYSIGAQPQLYNNDLIAVLAFEVATGRLALAMQDDTRPGERTKAIGSVVDLMWDLALRIEEGEFAMAEKQLRELQEALQKALAGDATDEEIQKLMDELQQAMDRYVDALKEKMEREPRGPRSRPQMNSNLMEMRREDLQKMLERARELAKSGSREAARDLLAQMQQLLENLQTQQMNAEMDPDLQEAMKMLDDMQKLIDRQQELLDQTFRDAQEQQQQGQQGQPQDGQQQQPGDGGQQQAAKQEGLRQGLGEMMRRYSDMMGDIPQSLGRAEGEMRESSRALGEGRPGDAVPPQSRALSDMQQALQDMTQKMAEALQSQQGRTGRDQFGRNEDPLGRDEEGMGSPFGDVQIPEQPDMQRAQEILEELRRRASERSRPRLERDYIERLLKQF